MAYLLPTYCPECAASKLRGCTDTAFHMLAEDLRRLEATGRELVIKLYEALKMKLASCGHGLDLRASGCKSQEVRVPLRASKSLFDMAQENAVEGCVRETFGAFVAASIKRKRQVSRIQANPCPHRRRRDAPRLPFACESPLGLNRSFRSRACPHRAGSCSTDS
jgi:hypothetical protein